MVQSVVRLDRVIWGYFLWVYIKSIVYANKPFELRMNMESKIAAVYADLCLKIVKIVSGDHQKKSSFIHNGIERTFTGIKN